MTFLQFVKLCGVKPTTGQSAWIKDAIDRQPFAKLTNAEREHAELMFGALDFDSIPSLARDVVVLVKGARIGGSMMSGLYLAWRSVTAKIALPLGEHAFAIVVGPDMRLGRQVLRYARGAIREVPALNAAIASESADGFTILRPDAQRIAVEVLPATAGGKGERGRSLVAAVMTESCFFRDANGVINDADIFRAIAPRVATIPGGQILLESTPWLEAGLTYELDRDNFANPTTALVAHAPTLLMRPGARKRRRTRTIARPR